MMRSSADCAPVGTSSVPVMTATVFLPCTQDSTCIANAMLSQWNKRRLRWRNGCRFEAKWRLLARVGVRCYILISNVSGAVKVAPLQILQFPVVLPHKFQDAEKFNLQFSDFSEITETADKLRWLRYQNGLRQRDVADYAGIDRSTYVHYEEYGKDLYPLEHMEKIAQLFEVPVDMLLDDYNLFLRNGQGEQIKAIRTKLGLTQKQYADKLGVSLGNLKHWEQNRKQIFKSTWEKYFKQGLESCE